MKNLITAAALLLSMTAADSLYAVHDGKLILRGAANSDLAAEKGQYPFGEPYYLLIDMQIQGSWVGKADPKQLPVEMEVDWVKFYELKEDSK